MALDNDDGMKSELERLRAKNKILKQTKLDSISFKVGQKGDIPRGQSLVVWAIAKGGEAARGVDKYLMSNTNFPHSQFFKIVVVVNL